MGVSGAVLSDVVRLLVSFVGGLGHLAPLLPVACAARDAGHEVAVAGSGGLVARIQEHGLAAYATSPQPHHDQAPTSVTRRPLEVMDAPAAETEFAQNFASRGARRMASAMPEVIRDFRPDLILRDETDLGTTIAAELADVPVAIHLVLASGLLIRRELVVPQLDVVRAEHGLPADPGLSRLSTGLVLSQAAPSFRSSEAQLQLTPTYYRSGRASSTPGHASNRRPRVYVTLGTIFAGASGDLFERLLAGLAELDADVIATVGVATDPADLGPQPANVRVERFLPQDEVLAGVDLVVSHGGLGSLMATLARGLPSLLLPLGADQPHNAVRAADLGVAVTLDAATVTAEDVAATARAVLEDDLMWRRCSAVADEILALPDLSVAVAGLVATAI